MGIWLDHLSALLSQEDEEILNRVFLSPKVSSKIFKITNGYWGFGWCVVAGVRCLAKTVH